MKKILLPTDFSENANNALAYAVDLANSFGSAITLVHAYQVYSTAGSFVSVESFMQEDAARELLKIVKDLEPKLKNGSTIDTKIIKGSTVDVITNVAEKQGFDAIVMGTQGASGLEEIFIGSTANGVIKNTDTPVLVIPSGFIYRPIQTIVLAVDEEEDFNAKILAPLVKIAQKNAALLRIYHKDIAHDGLNTTVDRYLDGLERTYHYELDTDNINEGINQFVREHKADLLCMIRRKRSFLEQVFHESVTTSTVFDSPVPLLILHEA